LPSQIEIRVNEVDSALSEWDTFVGDSGGDLVQTTMWGMSKRALGQDVVLVEARRRTGDLIGGALLIARRIGPGLRVGYVARGPVVAAGQGQITRIILEAVLSAARERRLAALIVQPETTDLEEEFRSRGFLPGAPTVAADASVRIDLTRSDESLLEAMSSSRRRDIRKSSREPIDIIESDDIEAFHTLHKRTADRRGFPPLSLAYLRAQWNALAASGAVRLMLAMHNGRPVAAKWLTRFGGVVTSRLAGWDAAASGKLHVNVALHWAAMQRARAAGATSYDFGGLERSLAEAVLAGATLPEDVHRTPQFFKLQFGAAPILHPQARFVILNPAVHFLFGRVVALLLRSRVAARAAKRFRNG
jgi:lipid II:glycine glycyltransferase (peptidoglycan interpeptide bridge formation enzyme)